MVVGSSNDLNSTMAKYKGTGCSHQYDHWENDWFIKIDILITLSSGGLMPQRRQVLYGEAGVGGWMEEYSLREKEEGNVEQGS